MRYSYIKGVFLLFILALLPFNEASAFDWTSYYCARVEASVVRRTGASVYDGYPGEVMVQTNEEDQSYGSSSSGVNGIDKSVWTGAGTVSITMKARPKDGYEFDAWKDNDGNTIANSSENTENFATGTSPGEDNARTYVRNAFFKVIPYTISFSPNGGTGTDPSPISYNIESTSTLPANPYTRDGYRFTGWKPSQTFGNWYSSTTYSPGTSVIEHFGTGSLTAQWEQLPCWIVIRLSGMEADESAIFTVSGGGKNFTVAVKPGTAVTLTDLTPGLYTVTPTSWSWVYEGLSAQSYNVPYTGHTFEFTATKKSGVKKHAEESQVNWGL